MSWSRPLTAVLLTALLGACTNTNVMLVDDRKFLSSGSPNLEIQVAADYERRPEDHRQYRYEFVNDEERRYILIQYFHKPVHTRNIDYFYNPLTWIFYDLPDCDEIEKGDLSLLDMKWYYRDYIHHPSTAGCAMVRDMGHFSPKQTVVKVLYWQDLPPHKCRTWKGFDRLSAAQQDKRAQFLKHHAEDIKMSIPAAAQ
jgi:hypothetical protein